MFRHKTSLEKILIMFLSPELIHLINMTSTQCKYTKYLLEVRWFCHISPCTTTRGLFKRFRIFFHVLLVYLSRVGFSFSFPCFLPSPAFSFFLFFFTATGFVLETLLRKQRKVQAMCS